MDKPNIIIILVDALRAKSLGCYGYEKLTSPTIDCLAQSGVLFENCFTCANASDPALTSLMSGMLIRSHGIVHHSFEVNDSEIRTFEARKVRFIQEILKENGYHTFAFDFLARWHNRGYDYYSEPNPNRTKRKRLLNQLSQLFALFGLRRFFKEIHSKKIFKIFFGGGDLHHDTESVENALEFISQKKNPYFLLVHLYGAHVPYVCPQVENKRSVEAYDGAIEIVDYHIKKIVEAAGKETLFVVLGDHGESLGEHDISFDHHGLYDPSLHVPLIFFGASVPKGRRIKGLVSTIDVFETVLSLAGIAYSGKTDSMDLTPYFERETNTIREFVFAEENYYQEKVCIRTEQYKFIKTVGRNICDLCHVKHGNVTELYDLKTDPEELNNIATLNREIRTAFEDKIGFLLRS